MKSARLHVLFLMVVAGGLTMAAQAQTPRQAKPSKSSRGDGGPAIRADVHPRYIALDAHGNLYIAETYEGSVRRIGTDGIITTVAGAPNPDNRFGGDGGPATRAFLASPQEIAVDGAGNVYICDTEYDRDEEQIVSSRIRRVSPDGIIKTIAGGGIGFSGDGGPAVRARFGALGGIAIDGRGNIYVADKGNDRIRRIDPSGIISTVAGNGTPEFSGDGGPATSASLRSPMNIAVDARGNLYIADEINDRIRMVNLAGVITTVAGGGAAGSTATRGAATRIWLHMPFSVAAGVAGEIYMAAPYWAHVLRVGRNGMVSIVAGNGTRGFTGDGGPAIKAQIRAVTIATDGRGNLYLAEESNGRIRMVNTSGVIRTIAGHGPIEPEGEQ